MPSSLQDAYSKLFYASPAPTLLFDGSANVVLANPAVEALFGYGPGQLTGSEVGQLLPSTLRAQPAKALREPQAGKRQGPDLRRGVRRDGSEVSVEVEVTPVELAEGCFGLLTCVQRSDTPTALDAALQARVSTLDQFVYTITHDFRAPVRGIKHAARWLREELSSNLSDHNRENLQLIDARVQRLSNLIDGLARYHRHQSRSPKPCPLELRPAVDEVIDAVAKGSECTVTVAGHWPTLVGDRDDVTQVLRELLDNALRFHDRPDGRVCIAATSTSDQLRVTVTDDGPGIEPDVYAWAFTMFKTLRAKEPDTAGVGLTLSKMLVERWGGEIGIEPASPRGTTVWFTIPATMLTVHELGTGT